MTTAIIATPARAAATLAHDQDATGQTDRERERAQIAALAEALHCRFSRDDCADYVIQGQSGNIHVDSAGYSVAVMLETKMQWTYALKSLRKFCSLRQRGDTEGVLHMAGLPTPAQAALLRNVLRVRKVKELSPETIAGIKARTAAYRFPASAKTEIKGEIEAAGQRTLTAG